jgi:TetR/AcrR family transcriptional regulator, regulator of cefoperazone and chloramphenicol sensitivity
MATPLTKRSEADARTRLLDAAIDIFGRYGLAGASTRRLARAAGVNLQAINYYFGGKEGLYLAAADHLADQVREHVVPIADRVRAQLADKASGRIGVEEARRLIVEMLTGMAFILFDEARTPYARFVVREQMDPTEAFDRIYEKMFAPQLALGLELVGIVLGEDPRSQHVKMRTLSLIGSLVFFRIAHATAERQLGWTRIGPRELAALRELILEVVGALGAQQKAKTRRKRS